jgi:hypothetical protein
MTAVVVASQPNHGCIHVAVDAAIYKRDQEVTAFGTKTYSVPHWPGVVVSVGGAALSPLVGWSLAQHFGSWDELAEGAENLLPSILSAWQTELGPQLSSSGDVILAGVSAERGPEAYSFRTDDTLPLTATADEMAGSDLYDAPFKLVKLPDLVMTPVPHDQVEAASYEGLDADADEATVLWSLRKILEMQRHMVLPDAIGGIGGFGQVTTISASGISQRVIQRWPDELGAPLRPEPIDWKAWHKENPKPVSGVRLEGLSRAKRDMLDRKSRKAALRLVR